MSQPTTPQSDYEYVFGRDPETGFCRWRWIVDCLQGDIQTFLDGMKYCYPWRDELQRLDGVSRGGGNLGAPIVIMSCLELLARLYVGDTQMTSGRATRNVKAFVAEYFEGPAKTLPGLLWDGIRNGLTHSLRPKPIMCQGMRVHFEFCQEHIASSVDHVSPVEVRVRISVPDLMEALRRATGRYEGALRAQESLQAKFRKAWGVLDAHAEPKVKDSAEEGALGQLLAGLGVGEGMGLFDGNVRVASETSDPTVSHYHLGTDHLYSLRFGAGVLATGQGTQSSYQVPRDFARGSKDDP